MKSLTTYIQDHKEGISPSLKRIRLLARSISITTTNCMVSILVLSGGVVREEKALRKWFADGRGPCLL